MKGNFVPGLVAVFATAAISGALVLTVTTQGVSGMASDSSQNSDSDWVQRVIGDEVVNKCDVGGIQDPSPIDRNITKSFDGIEEIEVERETYRLGGAPPQYGYRTNIILKYGGSQVKSTIHDDSSGVGSHLCGDFKVNGTESDGTSISAASSITLDDKDNLKFRVFEPVSGEAVLQVRQD